jgi:hypothetical protein
MVCNIKPENPELNTLNIEICKLSRILEFVVIDGMV